MIVTLHLSVHHGSPPGWPDTTHIFVRELQTPQSPDEGSEIVLIPYDGDGNGPDVADGVMGTVHHKTWGSDGSIHCWLQSVWIDPLNTPRPGASWWNQNTTWSTEQEETDFEQAILLNGWKHDPTVPYV